MPFERVVVLFDCENRSVANRGMHSIASHGLWYTTKSSAFEASNSSNDPTNLSQSRGPSQVDFEFHLALYSTFHLLLAICRPLLSPAIINDKMLAKRTTAAESLSSHWNFEQFRQLHRARRVIRNEWETLRILETTLNDSFVQSVATLSQLRGSLIVVGIGKAGWIGQKLSATFASTGTPSHFVHPAEAIHGDLGRFRGDDIVLVLSNSGETEEITRLLPHVKRRVQSVLAITSKPESTLARQADICLLLPRTDEACSHRLAPTSSTTAMLALGDALAMVVSDERQFRAEDFATLHPGGALGMKLKQVEDAMRPIEQCRITSIDGSIREVIVAVAKPGRRSGAMLLVDDLGCLVGLFTDSDLARLLEKRDDRVLDEPIKQHANRKFISCRRGLRLAEAVSIITERKISELPVVDESNRPLGMLDITDIVGLL